MIFVFLPAYSPDLNPLEYIWKSIRKDISKEIIESVTRLRELIRNQTACGHPNLKDGVC
jgi:putative transposase